MNKIRYDLCTDIRKALTILLRSKTGKGGNHRKQTFTAAEFQRNPNAPYCHSLAINLPLCKYDVRTLNQYF